MLRRETAAARAPGVPDAPTHASLVRARYGDAPPRRPRPRPNGGDNLTGDSPYEDCDPAVPTRYPAA
ncbi:hypothetical protein [Pseudonocardia sp. ICBG1293]|uniref:hypothetical protein n=1 Tax=Pseudonocardia sp. ICBG1293 TaxID=2844382 RepID=UPI00210656CE|nr:hypothetical protein [Pseudonocardia sp. ICBG1293]